VLDIKSGVYNQPYFLVNDAVAIRQFQMIISNEESMISKYPEDFRLYCIGEFDMHTGLFVAEKAPREVANGITFKKKD
jgi:hypothetical protein